MRNIFVLPTDKPSRLHNKNGELGNYPSTKLYIEDFKGNKHNSFHTYITSNEKPKEADWVITPTNDIIQWAKVFQPIGKKIILTTDGDLIKDGVQAIDDEFLQWFVDNPSCESIGVTFGCLEVRQCMCDSNARCLKPGYEIIIPKEEEIVLEHDYSWQSDIINEVWSKDEHKQETLEEAAEKAYKFEADSGFPDEHEHKEFLRIFKRGAKWQQEQDKKLYSEKEVLQLLHNYRNHFELYKNIEVLPNEFFKWFENYKEFKNK